MGFISNAALIFYCTSRKSFPRMCRKTPTAGFFEYNQSRNDIQKHLQTLKRAPHQTSLPPVGRVEKAIGENGAPHNLFLFSVYTER